MTVRIGFLGPEGTFSHQALRESQPPADAEAVAIATLYQTVMAVDAGEVDLALVPIENALEGSVDVTLDTLAADAGAVAIVGEIVQPVRNSLIAAKAIPLESITTVHSHPQPTGQCARFLRERLPGARIVAASSTAEAVRAVVARGLPGEAALGNQARRRALRRAGTDRGRRRRAGQPDALRVARARRTRGRAARPGRARRAEQDLDRVLGRRGRGRGLARRLPLRAVRRETST